MTELPIRGDVGKEEATRDPIFLFQAKRHHWPDVELPDNWQRDEEGDIVDTNLKDEHDLWARVSIKDLEERGVAIPYWATELVFFTREEGEAYGYAKSYNYSAGWRVYCVCAQGELARLLRGFSKTPTGDLP